MEDREAQYKKAMDLKESTEEVLKNFSNFVDEMKNTLPDAERKKLEEVLGSIDMSEIQQTTEKFTKELTDFTSKFKL